MQRKTKILIALAATCLAITCLFPPWFKMSHSVYKLELWDKFILAEHQGDKIDVQRLLVEWVGIVSIAILLGIAAKPVSTYCLAVWRGLLGHRKE